MDAQPFPVESEKPPTGTGGTPSELGVPSENLPTGPVGTRSELTPEKARELNLNVYTFGRFSLGLRDEFVAGCKSVGLPVELFEYEVMNFRLFCVATGRRPGEGKIAQAMKEARK